MQRRHLLTLAAAAAASQAPAFADTRPLRLVVPFPPGGATDITGRAISEPLARLLAWCQRRPPHQQIAVKAEADGSFRLIRFAGRGQKPAYVGEERFATLQEARHGAFLRHVKDLTET